ncbi:MAG: di-heme oxidoredictase family protein [Pirellulales bacterium]
MLLLRRALCSGGICTALVLFGLPQLGWSQDDSQAEAVLRGQELFERSWQPGQRPLGMVDGLGPLFNDRSCVACHDQGGVGGAGPLAKNVDLVTAQAPTHPQKRRPVRQRLIKLHAGFRRGWTIVLHRYNTAAQDYGSQREQLLGIDLAPDGTWLPGALALDDVVGSQHLVPHKRMVSKDLSLTWTSRNTTPLFGLGLIDQVTTSYLAQIAEEQHREHRQVTGRVLGKFGWRGQSNTLNDFVRGACSAELGLEPEPVFNGDVPEQVQEFVRQRGFDLSSEDCHDLTGFIASLPAPRRLEPADKQEAIRVRHGEELFGKLGCAVCHRPKLASIEGIYSDLLLHDMGVRLSDPSPAPQELRPTSTSIPTYYGGELTPDFPISPGELRVLQQEWKTPPLWGVRDSGPYLHDGRAATIAEAIAWHGGEAYASANRFAQLPAGRRAELVAFLMTLAAPDPDDLPVRVYPTDWFAAEGFAQPPSDLWRYQVARP